MAFKILSRIKLVPPSCYYYYYCYYYLYHHHHHYLYLFLHPKCQKKVADWTGHFYPERMLELVTRTGPQTEYGRIIKYSSVCWCWTMKKCGQKPEQHSFTNEVMQFQVKLCVKCSSTFCSAASPRQFDLGWGHREGKREGTGILRTAIPSFCTPTHVPAGCQLSVLWFNPGCIRRRPCSFPRSVPFYGHCYSRIELELGTTSDQLR